VSLSNQQVSSHLEDLNPPQLEAVQHFLGPIMVFAGAGSGKTRVLTRRITSLVLDHKVQPDTILAVTFTNKATEEMRARMKALLGDAADRIWIGTFHSTALRILRRHGQSLGYRPNFVVYDTDDSEKVIKQVLAELTLDPKKFPIKVYSRAIDSAKNRELSPEEYQASFKGHDSMKTALVYEMYQRELLKANAMDFGDLLLNIVKLFKENKSLCELYQRNFQFLLVDEFQDTNPVQYEFLKLLSEKHKNIFVVGDDDQSIYGFRGATIANIEYFKNDFSGAKIIKLEQNYRSTTNILETANAVIKLNTARTPKKLWTDGEEGEQVTTFVAWDEQEEARFVAEEIRFREKEGIGLNHHAILYRTNAQSRALEEALLDNGIPYRIFGGLKFYDRREIKDIIAYLKLLVNKDDNQAFVRVVNNPTRGVGPRAVEFIRQRASKESISLLEASRLEIRDDGPGGGKGIKIFLDLIDSFQDQISKIPLSKLIDKVIQDSGYGPKLKAVGDDDSNSRLENLAELKAIGASMERDEDKKEILSDFLDRVSLSSSQELPVEETKDKAKREPSQFVSLMTLHLAKGLEFPVVFLVGLEEGLLPHSRSIDDGNVEEERRLCYVGITRAMKFLYITRAKSRGMFSSGGSFGAGGGYREVSRFAREMPDQRLAHRSEKFGSFSAWSDSSIEIDDEFLEEDRDNKEEQSEPQDTEFFIRRKKGSAKEKSIKGKSGWLKTADSLD